MASSKKREEFLLQIGGRVVDTVTPPNGIPQAQVTVVELARTVEADAKGFYTFGKLPRRTYTFTATAKNFRPQTRRMEVPESRGDYFMVLERA